MSLPGFTALNSLYESSVKYSAGIQASSQSGAAQVVPQQGCNFVQLWGPYPAGGCMRYYAEYLCC